MSHRTPGAADFFIKRGDRLPSLEATLRNLDGTPLDLSAASTVTFVYRPIPDPTDLTPPAVVVTRASAVVVDALAGTVRYEWAPADTTTKGRFYFEFELNFAGRLLSVPNRGYLIFEVTDDLS